jgi:hypothetical protein
LGKATEEKKKEREEENSEAEAKEIAPHKEHELDGAIHNSCFRLG